MNYYVIADPHGFYSLMIEALTTAGYFQDTEPHKLVLLGDLFDRGREAAEMQQFVMEHMETGDLILIRGNHEDLFEELATKDRGKALSHHLGNGTYDTALLLTGMDLDMAIWSSMNFAAEARRTDYYRCIIPAMRDYWETEHYVFVHGWIPQGSGDWRCASPQEWRAARWTNGIDASRCSSAAGKTIVCGHWHCSYGHAKYEGKGSEFGEDADFSPYYGDGVLALDACTALSGRVNCVVLQD